MRRRSVTGRIALASTLAIGVALVPVALAPAAAVESAAPAAVPQKTVRTIVTTDPELDDLNSLLRMLLYSNEIDIEGLVYSSSQHHFEGDPEAGVAPFRWPEPDAVFHIDTAVNAYEASYDNLKVHDSTFPAPEQLRSLIKWGNVKTKGDMAEPTEGSDWIKDKILDDEAGELFLEAWGGPNTIARALLSIQEQYEGTAEWPAIQQKVYDKVVLTSFGQQDDTFATYIRPNWPELRQREVSTSIWGYGARNSALPEWQKYLSPEWTAENVSSVGPIGAEYRVWGDGKQMAAGFDDEDYFGLSGYTREELEAMGYGVWTPPQSKGAWISEGDSSNFALLIDNGLRNWEDPTWGGWGGRQAVNPADPYQWRNRGVTDIGPDGQPRSDFSAGRWFEDFQLDFAARLQWSVTPEYADANHGPETSVKEGLDLGVVRGEKVTLHGTASDPDGDALGLRWWQYSEADTYAGTVALTGATTRNATFTVPADAKTGDTIHLLFEAKDPDGLKEWERVVLTVQDANIDLDLKVTGVKKNGTVALTGSAVNLGNSAVAIRAVTKWGDVKLGTLAEGATFSYTLRTGLKSVPAGSVVLVAKAPDGTEERFTVRYSGTK
jgi:hypothetical protein